MAYTNTARANLPQSVSSVGVFIGYAEFQYVILSTDAPRSLSFFSKSSYPLSI